MSSHSSGVGDLEAVLDRGVLLEEGQSGATPGGVVPVSVAPVDAVAVVEVPVSWIGVADLLP